MLWSYQIDQRPTSLIALAFAKASMLGELVSKVE